MGTRNQNTPNKPNNGNAEKEIKNHKEAAAHLESAAKHYEEGHSERAVECNSKAQECTDKAINGTETKPQINL